ncbi:uncharacterized protein LOC121603106 [Anopheles merus]|uniref:uncharacterized protein LOC121603106 n=1 Tax=Anopheles merus TaxID=30066 RepID=UPI001BE482EC|nr:uncharacterized protein LOC121603106 [Anopheles merus]
MLKQLYGRPGLLVKELIGQARRAEAPRLERLDQLISFGITVQRLCDHLIASEMEEHFSNPELLEELVEKLPASRKLEWIRFKRNFEKATLREFCAFMEELTEDCCELTVPGNVENIRVPVKIHRGHTFTHYPPAVEVTHDTPRQLKAETSSPVVTDPNRAKCYVCKDPAHHVRQCETFKSMSVADRLNAVTSLKLCRNCLNNHGTRECKSRFVCTIDGCGAQHHMLLHQNTGGPRRRMVQFHYHTTKSPHTLFHVTPVTVHNGQTSVDTYALMDEASSLTTVEAALAEQLGLNGVREPLEICWTGNIKRQEDSSQCVQLQISARGEERRYTIAAAHTIKS